MLVVSGRPGNAYFCAGILLAARPTYLHAVALLQNMRSAVRASLVLPWLLSCLLTAEAIGSSPNVDVCLPDYTASRPHKSVLRPPSQPLKRQCTAVKRYACHPGHRLSQFWLVPSSETVCRLLSADHRRPYRRGLNEVTWGNGLTATSPSVSRLLDNATATTSQPCDGFTFYSAAACMQLGDPGQTVRRRWQPA
jgi:hypothetical protein